MPRYARKKSDIGIFHIMLRGMNKQIIFEDDEDRERFLKTIERFKKVSKYEVYGFCLMSNHNQNPIKAGLAECVEDYIWSSYKKYIGIPIIVDTGFILQIFSVNKEKTIESFIEYTNEQNEDKCLDFIEKVRLIDSDVRSYFVKLGIQNNSELQQVDREKRNEIIRKMKSIEGVTVR